MSADPALLSVLVATDAQDLVPAVVPDVAGAPRGLSPMLWSRLVRALPDNPTEMPTVLDCGGGSGSLAVPLAVHGAQVTVVDISIDALSILLRRAAEAGVSDRVTAVQGDVEALSEALSDDQFDLVLAHGVLENVPDPALAVAEVAAVLRPGGVASLLVANPVATVLGRLLAGDVSGALDWFRRSETTGYRPDAAIEQCLAAGLTLESVEGIGVFTEMVPGIELERSGALHALRELEQATSQVSPYREIASRLHVVVRRPAQVSG